MSLKRAFRAFFGNPDWLKKSALGMLGMLVPYVGSMVVMGYGIEYMRGVAWRDDDKLPEWDRLERYLKTGFFAFVVGLVYSLPIGLVMSILIVISLGVMAAVPDPDAFVLPLVIVITFLTLPITVAWTALVQGAFARFAAYDTIGEGLRVGEVIASVRRTAGALWGALWRVWIMSLGLSGIISLGYGVIIGGMVAATISGSDGAALAALPLMYCGQFVVVAITIAVGVLVQLISFHVWGQYLAVAYPEPHYDGSAAQPDPIARYGAGHDVLPTAPTSPKTPPAPPAQPPVEQ